VLLSYASSPMVLPHFRHKSFSPPRPLDRFTAA
jgi:hypothetical protein